MRRISWRAAAGGWALACGWLFGSTIDAAEGDRPRMVVVAPRALAAAVKQFVAHKNKSLDATLVTLEDALARGEGVDDAEKLKRFLYAERRERGLDYVLLVGDVDVLPVRFMTLDRKSEPAFDYAFYPSDLYYADLAKADGSFEDWNARRDGFHAGYFGEVRGEANKDDPINFDEVDFRPEAAVGRWPVSTADEARRVAAKTIRYDRAAARGKGDHLRRAGLVAVGGWVDSRSLMDGLAERLGAAWDVEKRYYADGRRDSGTPAPTRDEVRGLFNRGMGLVVHAGHGQNDEWEQCLRVADLDGFDNGDALPVVVSAGCSTANFAPLPPYRPYVDVDGAEHRGSDLGERFDAPPPPPANYQTGKYNVTGLGEQMLKRPENGAVAYIGCNTGSQPCALGLVEGFVESLASADEPRLGDCWNAAVARYYERERLATLKPDEGWYPPSIFFQPMKFMVFGDPSLVMGRGGK
jgi:hypothetical protein